VPDLAVDEAEYDLALLEGLFRLPEAVSAGSARYLLSANTHLARALRFRARRWTIRKWAASDGLVDPAGRARTALDRHAFASRTYAATTLEKFASCPYRFFLYAVHHLAPREEPEAIDALDATQRGALVHAALHALGEALQGAGLLPVTSDNLDRAKELLDPVITEVATRFEGELAPAIARTWDDGIAAARADLGEWLRQAANAYADGYRPWKFELSFGKPAPVVLDSGVQLVGSIDLVERSAVGTLRATDYKTGKPRDLRDGAAIAGGEVLQPLLYASALEKLFPEMPVDGGRLYYCTSAGGFEEARLPLDEQARAAVAQATGVIGDALTAGFLPAAPAAGACATCDYRVVCGPYEETRAARKSVERLASLRLLRSLP
jgi:RecB family exonuclease